MLLPRVIASPALLLLLDFANALPQASPPQEREWVNLAPLTFARQEHSTVAINDTTIAIVGGVTPVFEGSTAVGLQTSDSVQFYNIPSDTWRNVTRTPYPVNHPNVISVNGSIYLLGGLANREAGQGGMVDWVASGESHVYDPRTDTWSELEPMPRGTERGSAILGVHGELIYVAGGMTVLDPDYQDAISTVTAFNTTSGEWQRLPERAANIPEGRQHGVGAVVGNIFFVIGGRWFEKTNVRATVFMLNLTDPEAGWTTARRRMPTARGGIYGGVVGDEFFVFGGEANPDSVTGVFDQCEVFNVETRQWTELPPMAVPRHGTSAARVGNRIYIPGGGLQEDGLPVVTNGVESFLNTTDHFDAFSV